MIGCSASGTGVEHGIGNKNIWLKRGGWSGLRVEVWSCLCDFGYNWNSKVKNRKGKFTLDSQTNKNPKSLGIWRMVA